ncbi:MAG: hypothetical protein V4723_20150 [Pseudomonadota bacterium]
MSVKRDVRLWVLAAIVALHVLLLWLWPQFRLDEDTHGPRQIFLTLIAPKLKPQPVVAPPATPRAKPVAITPRVRAVPQSVPDLADLPATIVEPQAITIPAAPDPFADPAPAARPKYDIAAIDKEVRKASRDPAVRVTVLQATKMERLIGGAKKQRGPAQVEEMVLSDGTRVSKVGTMCAMKKPTAMVGGYDPFRNGNESIWRQCPK